MKSSKKFILSSIVVAAFLLHGCAHQPTAVRASSVAPAPEQLSDQARALALAAQVGKKTESFLVIDVPSANNAISNAMMLSIWGMEGSHASNSITNLVHSGVSYFGVSGESIKVNMAAVRAALKGVIAAKRATDIFVFVGDSKPNEQIVPPAGIKVHLVRADGSLWP